MTARTVVACAAVAAFSLASASGADRIDRNVVAEDSQSGEVLTARLIGEMPSPVEDMLNAAYGIAVNRVRTLDSCRELFSELGENGLEILGRTKFSYPQADWEVKVCKSAVAFTWVRGQTTVLCRSFKRTTKEGAASILLHEALHHAGLGEYPHDPAGMTPIQINKMVEGNCSLKIKRRGGSAFVVAGRS